MSDFGEMLFTYGWAFLMVIIVAAALFALGVFDPVNTERDPSEVKESIERAVEIVKGAQSDITLDNCDSSIANVYGIYFVEGHEVYPNEELFPNSDMSEPLTINVCGNVLKFINWSYMPRHNLCYDETPGHIRCWVYYEREDSDD